MKKGLKIGVASLAALMAFGTAGCSVKDKDGKAWAEKNGYVKASDYNIDLKDDSVTGASENKETVANQLTQAQIKQLILDELRGFVLYWYKGDEKVYPEYEENQYPHTQDKEQIARMEAEGYTAVYSYREMYQIATAHNNVPTISSVEYVLDTGTMKLYGSSEKGTAKVVEIVNNPNVELYWTKQVDEKDYFAASADSRDYWRSYGVQFIGTARIIDTEKEGTLYNKVANMYMETMRGTKGWMVNMTEAQRTAIVGKLKGLNVWYEITPTQINSHNLWNMYNKDNVCSTAAIVNGKVETTVQTCPTLPEGTTPTEEALKAAIAADSTKEGWHVNETAMLVNDSIVWIPSSSAGSLYKWTDGMQKKWAKALYGKFYRQVLTDFDVTPAYPAEVTDTKA